MSGSPILTRNRSRQRGQSVVEFILMVIAMMLLVGFVRTISFYELDVFNRLNMSWYRAFRTADSVQIQALYATDQAGRIPILVEEHVTGGDVVKLHPAYFLGRVDWSSPQLVYPARNYTLKTRTYMRNFGDDLNTVTSWLIIKGVVVAILQI